MFGNWNDYYKTKPPLLSIHPFMPELSALFKEKGVKRILDLGCGAGRHLIYLSQKGFDVFGLDSSPEALRIAHELSTQNNLHANLTLGSMFGKLPYEDGYFDAIICCRALNHGTIGQIRSAILEIKRSVRQSHFIFVEVRKPSLPYQYGQKMEWMDEIAPRTRFYHGEDNGIHYQFNKAILLKEFCDFKILKFWIDEQRYYCLLGQLK
jgi:SAM-dependent methyltransferase